MNAEELEIARRLVACKGWVWLPGMMVMDANGERSRISCEVDGWPEGRTFILCLDDELTRLGVLAVVRRAWGMPLLCTYPVKMADCAPWWNVGVPWSPNSGGVFCETGSTEIAALLAALEAAP